MKKSSDRPSGWPVDRFMVYEWSLGSEKERLRHRECGGNIEKWFKFDQRHFRLLLARLLAQARAGLERTRSLGLADNDHQTACGFFRWIHAIYRRHVGAWPISAVRPRQLECKIFRILRLSI